MSRRDVATTLPGYLLEPERRPAGPTLATSASWPGCWRRRACPKALSVAGQELLDRSRDLNGADARGQLHLRLRSGVAVAADVPVDILDALPDGPCARRAGPRPRPRRKE